MSPDMPSGASASHSNIAHSNIAQWLAEIQALQKQVAELTAERDRAYASADNLRGLYEAEAEQRQRETTAAQRKVEAMQKTVLTLQSAETDRADDSSTDLPNRLAQEIEAVKRNRSVKELQIQLIQTKKQLFQTLHQLGQIKQSQADLVAQLEAEQAAHEKTKQSMTAALGDAVDLLAKERHEGHPDRNA